MPVAFAQPASVACHEPSACSTNFQSDVVHAPGDVCRNMRLARSQPRVVGGSTTPGAAGVVAHPHSDDTTIAPNNAADVRGLIKETSRPVARHRAGSVAHVSADLGGAGDLSHAAAAKILESRSQLGVVVHDERPVAGDR